MHKHEIESVSILTCLSEQANSPYHYYEPSSWAGHSSCFSASSKRLQSSAPHYIPPHLPALGRQGDQHPPPLLFLANRHNIDQEIWNNVLVHLFYNRASLSDMPWGSSTYCMSACCTHARGESSCWTEAAATSLGSVAKIVYIQLDVVLLKSIRKCLIKR